VTSNEQWSQRIDDISHQSQQHLGWLEHVSYIEMFIDSSATQLV